MGDEVWDVVVVGAGPAGCAAAARVLRDRADARVLLLDRAEFPRDKACGDGIAAEALDALAELGFDRTALTEGYPPVRRLRLCSPANLVADRELPTPVQVIPRTIFDHRVLSSVLARGAVFERRTVRSVQPGPDAVVVDGELRARVVIGADGAESSVRRSLGLPANPPGHVALAIRGYAPELPGQDGAQWITMSDRQWPAYAWSFATGNGDANVGYGERLTGSPSGRADMLAHLRRLLPGVDERPALVRAHRLPLSTWRPPIGPGRILLAGDAQSLINPLSGEGIFYAVVSGELAGAAALSGATAGSAYRQLLNRRLGRHLRHTSTLAWLARSPRLMDAGVRASARTQRTFNDLVTLGLADGLITPRLVAGLRP